MFKCQDTQFQQINLGVNVNTVFYAYFKTLAVCGIVLDDACYAFYRKQRHLILWHFPTENEINEESQI